MRIGRTSIDIYCDGADVDTIRIMCDNPLVAGFTTNPSLARKAGVSDYLQFCQSAYNAADGRPISFEVLSEEPHEIVRQCNLLASIGKTVFVKIPAVTSQGRSNLDLIHSLSRDGFHINATAVFTYQQAFRLLNSFRDTGTPSIISIFAGRIADAGIDPEEIVRPICSQVGAITRCKILWASPRQTYNAIQAANCGCDIITMFPAFIEKLSLFGKDLFEFSCETAAMFSKDAEEAGYQL